GGPSRSALPEAEGGAPADDPPPVTETLRGTARSLRILIVEDEEHIRQFLAAGLTQLGHRPRVTAEAGEALAAFAEEAFDVVITDFGLPGVTGEEVARRVAERSPNTP